MEFGPSGKEGERQTRLGGLSRQLLGDQDSRRCTRRGRDMEFGLLGREGGRRTRLGGLSRQLMGDRDSGVAPGGEETWSLAHQARREKGKPAWEGSRSNCWEIKTPALHQAGKRHGVLAHREEREKGKPAWEGSHYD
ncbi:hypothetical protein ROHU_014973 [Labeo rohita]|uniref:Uncharacterized protein n=1 Tax=Labeo rohita TaxID=84645 RepID=A0A498NRF9_LABRO|nr:hypothetical protein ROHU_014973 [Labeo rohita]